MTTKSSNKNLHKANKAKKDEFYTQLVDIEKELKHYKDQFRGKVVYCNCDDPYESNFFKYFANKFNELGLKKLIATSFLPSPIIGKQLMFPGMETPEKQSPKSKSAAKGDKHAWKIEISEVRDEDANGAFDLRDVAKQLTANKHNELTALKGNGDFRSDECIELLKQADIVVTNPPFSLFREYVAQLFKYNKKFLIIGSKNAIIYKECFKFIKDNKMWLGPEFTGGNAYFKTPYANDNYADGVYNPETGLVKFRNVGWFTNLEYKERHDDLVLFRKYTPEIYQKYDNYDAIEVSKVSEIPMDYEGVIGVPVTFLDRYNPDQFEIIGSNRGVDQDPNGIYGRGSYLNGKETFKRLFIKNKKVKK